MADEGGEVQEIEMEVEEPEGGGGGGGGGEEGGDKQQQKGGEESAKVCMCVFVRAVCFCKCLPLVSFPDPLSKRKGWSGYGTSLFHVGISALK